MESLGITKSLSTAVRAIDSQVEDEGSGEKLILLRTHPSPPEPPSYFKTYLNYSPWGALGSNSTMFGGTDVAAGRKEDRQQTPTAGQSIQKPK